MSIHITSTATKEFYLEGDWKLNSCVKLNFMNQSTFKMKHVKLHNAFNANNVFLMLVLLRQF